MPDLEELIRRTLLERQTTASPSQDLLVAAQRKRRKRRTGLAVLGVAVATAAAVTAPVALISSHRSPGSGTASSTTARPPAPPATDAPGIAADSPFTVAPPMLTMVFGPIPMQHPDCRPAQISATAELRSTAYGVVGVVEMHGDHCSIPMYPGPSALVAASGNALDVPIAPGNLVGSNARPDLAFAAGDAAWGFAWTGSWCGEAPAGVVLPLTGRFRSDPMAEPSLVVPLSGPVLPCHGASDSVLVRGAPGTITSAVLPPPSAWASLTAAVHLRDTSHSGTGLTVVLTNNSADDVVLDPCPRYTVAIDFTYADGGTQNGHSGLFPCSDSVPAGGTLRVDLPRVPLNDDDNRRPTSATLRFGIGGVEPATVDIPLG